MSVRQTVAEVLSKHVVLEVKTIDRMYLNVYVPQLRAVEATLKFIRIHRGHKVASTRMVEPITREFVASIERFAKDNQIPLITFEKGHRRSDEDVSACWKLARLACHSFRSSVRAGDFGFRRKSTAG